MLAKPIFCCIYLNVIYSCICFSSMTGKVVLTEQPAVPMNYILMLRFTNTSPKALFVQLLHLSSMHSKKYN